MLVIGVSNVFTKGGSSGFGLLTFDVFFALLLYGIPGSALYALGHTIAKAPAKAQHEH